MSPDGQTTRAAPICWPGPGPVGGPAGRATASWSWSTFPTRPLRAGWRLPWADIGARSWQFTDLLEETGFDRDGAELQSQGLFVSLDPWQAHTWPCADEAWLTLAKRHFTGGS